MFSVALEKASQQLLWDFIRKPGYSNLRFKDSSVYQAGRI